MTRAVRFARTGGPDVLDWQSVTLAPPGAGEVRVRIEAAGLNFIDTYHRSGLYPVALPSGLGIEAAGVIEACGAGVTALTPGDRVATAWGPIGCNATHANLPADVLVRLPEGIDSATAAALLLKGCTVEYLVKRTFSVQPGQFVLWHAAAGATGLIAGQWLAALGAIAIGTASTDEKCALARAHGYAHVLNSAHEDIAARVREITGGAGCPVVYDGVGRATWEASLASTAPRGLIVSFGNASGPVEGLSVNSLQTHGSLYLTRPTLFHYYADPREKAQGCADVFEMIGSGAIRPVIGRRWPMAEVAHAHRALESRQTTGSVLLLP